MVKGLADSPSLLLYGASTTNYLIFTTKSSATTSANFEKDTCIYIKIYLKAKYMNPFIYPDSLNFKVL